jgi:hypothetical protein
LIFSNLTGGSFAVGDTVVGATSNATAIVDSVIDSSTIAVHQNIGTGFTPFQSSETIEVGSVSATVDMVIEPEVDVRTGQLLYIENISPVTRNVNQTEDIRLVLEL